jgi:hypothetical protein
MNDYIWLFTAAGMFFAGSCWDELRRIRKALEKQ